MRSSILDKNLLQRSNVQREPSIRNAVEIRDYALEAPIVEWGIPSTSVLTRHTARLAKKALHYPGAGTWTTGLV